MNDAILTTSRTCMSFAVERTNKVTEEFLAVGGKLGKVATEVMTALARKPSSVSAA